LEQQISVQKLTIADLADRLEKYETRHRELQLQIEELTAAAGLTVTSPEGTTRGFTPGLTSTMVVSTAAGTASPAAAAAAGNRLSLSPNLKAFLKLGKTQSAGPNLPASKSEEDLRSTVEALTSQINILNEELLRLKSGRADEPLAEPGSPGGFFGIIQGKEVFDF